MKLFWSGAAYLWLRRIWAGLVLMTLLALVWPAQAQQTAPAQCTPQITSVKSSLANATGPVPELAATQDWAEVSLPDDWTKRWPQHEGAVWYQINWSHPCAVNAEAEPVALGISGMILAGEVFSNQDLIWRDRHLVEPLSRSWNLPRQLLLPAPSLRQGENQIWVRVHGVPTQTPGLLPVRLGSSDEIANWYERRWWHQRSLFVMNMVVSCVLGVLFLFAWIQRPSNTAFGWYALNALCWVLFLSNVLMVEAWPFPNSTAAGKFNALAFFAFCFSFHLFTWRFGGLRFPRIELALWIYTAVVLGAILFVPNSLKVVSPVASWLSLGFGLLGMVQFVFHALCTRKPEHLVYGVCQIAFFVAAVHDYLALTGITSSSEAMTPYTTPLTMLSLALILGRQIELNMRRTERFNQELAQSVTVACDELSTTLEREHELALSHSRLQERMSVSQDLHDSLGGSLVRSIASVEQATQPMSNPQFLSMLKLMRDDLRQMIDAGTGGATHTPATPKEWAAPLRYRFVGLFDELDVTSRWDIPAAWSSVPAPLQCLALTRLVEEALTNVIKHSRAKNVLIELILPNSEVLELRITDDGVGFDVQAQSGSMGVGMRSMRSRVERQQGRLTVSSQPSGGTCIEVQMPLEAGSTTGHQSLV